MDLWAPVVGGTVAFFFGVSCHGWFEAGGRAFCLGADVLFAGCWCQGSLCLGINERAFGEELGGGVNPMELGGGVNARELDTKSGLLLARDDPCSSTKALVIVEITLNAYQ